MGQWQCNGTTTWLWAFVAGIKPKQIVHPHNVGGTWLLRNCCCCCDWKEIFFIPWAPVIAPLSSNASFLCVHCLLVLQNERFYEARLESAFSCITSGRTGVNIYELWNSMHVVRVVLVIAIWVDIQDSCLDFYCSTASAPQAAGSDWMA